MLDQQILSAWIEDRNAFEKTKDYVSDKDCTPGIAFWLALVRAYYERDRSATAVDKILLRSLGEQRINNPKHSDAILGTLSSLPSASPANATEYVLNLRRYNLSAEFASAAMSGDRKKASELLAEINSIWSAETIEGEKSEIEYAKGWDELDSVVGAGNRIPLGLPSLDSRIGGGVLPGHHILIFGRTEIGKSLCTTALTANLLRAGKTVLYVGNEDNINVLKARIRQSVLGWSLEKITALPKKANRMMGELVGERLTMAHVHPGSMSELEDLADRHSPSIFILDQIRNVGGSEDGMTQKMEQNAIRFRSLLSKKGLIGISVTQAGDRSQGHNSQGPIYLSAGDVDSSRVGLPAQADLMLGIGADSNMMARNLRMISFAKNKLHSGPSSREPLCVRFDFTTNRILES